MISSADGGRSPRVLTSCSKAAVGDLLTGSKRGSGDALSWGLLGMSSVF